MFSEAIMGDPVALRQKATPGRDSLKPMQTSTANGGVVQRGAENLKPDKVRDVREVYKGGGRGDLPDRRPR